MISGLFQGYYKDTVEFYFDTRNECKNFWKKCIEHHAFFRYAVPPFNGLLFDSKIWGNIANTFFKLKLGLKSCCLYCIIMK